MKVALHLPLACAVVVALAASLARAASFTYTSLDVPGSSTTLTSGTPDALNDSDEVVGATRVADGSFQGFLWQNGAFTLYPQARTLTVINDGGFAVGLGPSSPGYLTIDTATGTTRTYADGFRGNLLDINASGAVAAQEVRRQVGVGYVLINGAKTRIMVAGTNVPFGGTYPTAINANGAVTGSYSTGNGLQNEGFVYAGGIVTTFSVPNSANTNPVFIRNDGAIGGSFTSTIAFAPIGFVLRNGLFYGFLPPDGFASVVVGIGPGGEVVGSFESNQIKQHGFIYVGDAFAQIDFPGGSDTAISGVNARGSLVGSYLDAKGVQHAFIAQCAEGVVCTQ